MKTISKEQLKILAAGLIIIVAFFCFWAFIYTPQSKKLNSIKSELTLIESQIAEINKITQGQDISLAVKELNSQLISTASNLAASQEEVISNLSNKARLLKIGIKSIVPQEKLLLENKVAGYIIEELSISMSLQCEFRDLGRYLDLLRNNFPYLTRVKSLEVKGEGEGKPILGIALEIVSYLSKPSPDKR